MIGLHAGSARDFAFSSTRSLKFTKIKRYRPTTDARSTPGTNYRITGTCIPAQKIDIGIDIEICNLYGQLFNSSYSNRWWMGKNKWQGDQIWWKLARVKNVRANWDLSNKPIGINSNNKVPPHFYWKIRQNESSIRIYWWHKKVCF